MDLCVRGRARKNRKQDRKLGLIRFLSPKQGKVTYPITLLKAGALIKDYHERGGGH